MELDSIGSIRMFPKEVGNNMGVVYDLYVRSLLGWRPLVQVGASQLALVLFPGYIKWRGASK